jgi:biotin transport system permease protein
MLTAISAEPSPWHRLPAGAKLAAVAGLGLGLALTGSLPLLATALLLAAAAYLPLGAGRAARGLRALWVLWPFVAIILGWHLWRGTPELGLAVVLRLLALVLAANLLTLTTRLQDLLATLRRLLRPLGALGLPVNAVALSFAMALRFLPVLLARASELDEAWRARAPRRARVRLLAPLALAALDEADHAAEALRARGGAG